MKPSSLRPPPADFASCELHILQQLSPLLYRIHPSARAPLFASHAYARFSSPALPFGVCYCSRSPLGALAETFLPLFPDPADPASALTPVASGDFIRSRSLSTINPGLTFRYADLSNNGIAGMHLSSLINNTDDYDLTQQWAAAFHNHPEHIDALCYFAARAPREESYAIFERALPRLRVLETTPLSEHPDLLRSFASTFGFTLLDLR